MIGFIAESAGDVRDCLAVLVASTLRQHGKRGFEDPETLCDAVFGAQPPAFLDIHKAPAAARAHGLRIHGRKQDLGLLSARAALAVFEKLQPELRLDALVLTMDADLEASRRSGLEAARDAADWSFAIALALPSPEIEAWYLVTFAPDDDEGEAKLEAIRKQLGFDPTKHVHRLRSTDPGSPRDTKHVLELLDLPYERRRAQLERPLDELRQCSGASGLAEFLDELEARLVPLF